MDLAQEFRKGWVVAAGTVQYLLTTRRVIAMGLLAALPLVVAGSLALARVPTYDIFLFQVVMVPLFLQVVLIFVTLVNTTALIREEIDDNTLPYLLMRPIGKPAIVLWKYAGYLVAVLVLLVPPLLLAYVVTEAYTGLGLGADTDVLAGFLAVAVLGSVTYGALFLFISVLLRKPLAVGLLIGFVWESIVGSVPGNVPKLSVVYYLRSVLKGLIDAGPFPFQTDVSAGLAAGILVALSAAFLLATIVVFQRNEFRQKV